MSSVETLNSKFIKDIECSCNEYLQSIVDALGMDEICSMLGIDESSVTTRLVENAETEGIVICVDVTKVELKREDLFDGGCRDFAKYIYSDFMCASSQVVDDDFLSCIVGVEMRLNGELILFSRELPDNHDDHLSFRR